MRPIDCREIDTTIRYFVPGVDEVTSKHNLLYYNYLIYSTSYMSHLWSKETGQLKLYIDTKGGVREM